MSTKINPIVAAFSTQQISLVGLPVNPTSSYQEISFSGTDLYKKSDNLLPSLQELSEVAALTGDPHTLTGEAALVYALIKHQKKIEGEKVKVAGQGLGGILAAEEKVKQAIKETFKAKGLSQMLDELPSSELFGIVEGAMILFGTVKLWSHGPNASRSPACPPKEVKEPREPRH